MSRHPAVALLALLGLVALVARADDAGRDARVASIRRDLEKLRGVKFRDEVAVEQQSIDAFRSYVDRSIVEQVPEERLASFGKIVEKLGLYRGPRLENYRETVTELMATQAIAYYDPQRATFSVVMTDLPDSVLDPTFAHELYHALQDQRHDLEAYYLSGDTTRALDDDALLARQAVVEGEATYVMTLWSIESQLGQRPERAVLSPMIRMQAAMDTATIAKMLEQSAQLGMGSDMASAARAMTELPPFLIETLMGAYLKGMSFVFDVHADGWDRVDALYTDPPVSTEQILHPEKWRAHERPLRYTWPDLAQHPATKGWNVLDSNVVGELQLRIVFTEHDVPGYAAARIAAGWDGDAYTVLEQRDGDALLLLWATSWDDAEQAAEFETAYRKLLAKKYPEGGEVTRVVARGKDVWIVEGGAESDADARVELLAGLSRER